LPILAAQDGWSAWVRGATFWPLIEFVMMTSVLVKTGQHRAGASKEGAEEASSKRIITLELHALSMALGFSDQEITAQSRITSSVLAAPHKPSISAPRSLGDRWIRLLDLVAWLPLSGAL
jgi:hypothetical protein